MKRIFNIIALFTALTSLAQEYSAMTYNIRLDVEIDGENAWPYRKDAMVQQLLEIQPSVFGIQEGLPHQVFYLNDALDNYDHIGRGRNAGGTDEYSAIFYNSNDFEVLKEGTFWLSETPRKVSKGWDALLPRICTYGLFKDKVRGTEFWVFNTHYDHKGELARENSSQLLMKRIKKITKRNDVVLLMGDFNAEPNSQPITILSNAMNDCYEVSSNTSGPNFTLNGFNPDLETKKRIDYIFISNNETSKVSEYAVLDDTVNERFISDHFPVYIKFHIL